MESLTFPRLQIGERPIIPGRPAAKKNSVFRANENAVNSAESVAAKNSTIPDGHSIDKAARNVVFLHRKALRQGFAAGKRILPASPRG